MSLAISVFICALFARCFSGGVVDMNTAWLCFSVIIAGGLAGLKD